MNDWDGWMKAAGEAILKTQDEIIRDALMNDCQKRGCRNLETKCLDCGRAVNKMTAICGEWVKVKDRLPDHYESVFVCDFHHPADIDIDYIQQSDGNWASGSDWTHWQSLPEPPEKE